jgi:hypothetical protein
VFRGIITCAADCNDGVDEPDLSLLLANAPMCLVLVIMTCQHKLLIT